MEYQASYFWRNIKNTSRGTLNCTYEPKPEEKMIIIINSKSEKLRNRDFRWTTEPDDENIYRGVK